MKKDGMIHIPARKRTTSKGSQVIRVSDEAYQILIELSNASYFSLSQIASLIIKGSVDRIVFDWEDAI